MLRLSIAESLLGTTLVAGLVIVASHWPSTTGVAAMLVCTGLILGKAAIDEIRDRRANSERAASEREGDETNPTQ